MTDRLLADCDQCFALCCVGPAFARSADFAIDKPAGTPCPNLLVDDRCGIHTQLRDTGFRGCTVYDCFGAGQRVSRETFDGEDWRARPRTAPEMFAALGVVRQLHELLYYLREALAMRPAKSVHAEIRSMFDSIDTVAGSEPARLLTVDVAPLRADANRLLQRASELTRATVPGKKKDLAGSDLVGKPMRGKDLRGASLRGALLIGADFRGADLRFADFTGADMRDTDLAGADLRDALFLTQAQLTAARGDTATRLGPRHAVPAHWQSSAPRVR